MLTEDQIKRALHAQRVAPTAVANPHGPLGLEQLAEAVARLRGSVSPDAARRVERVVSLRQQTWEKLDELARTASKSNPVPVTAADIAVAILEDAVNGC